MNQPVSAPAFKATSAAQGASVPGDPTKAPQAPVIKKAAFSINPLGSRQQYIKCLFYGKHGMGKTTLVNTAVDCEPMRDVLFIDAEKGETAVTENPRIKNADLISHVELNTFKQCAHIHDWLFAHCTHRDANNEDKLRELESIISGVPAKDIETPKKFRTVIIDPLSEVDAQSLYALRGIKEEQLYQDPSEMEKMEWKEYGMNNEMMKMLIRRFRDLPMHVLLCCGRNYIQDEMKRFHYSPQITGKLSAQVQGMVDIVGYVVAESQPNKEGEYNRHVFVQPGVLEGARFDAKNRRAIYKKASFENPTMESIMRETGMLK